MADKGKKAAEADSGGGTATVKPRKKHKPDQKPTPTKKPPGFLPPWKVLLHNDDKNDVVFVIGTIMELTPLNEMEAKTRTVEADKTGVALLLVTHKERAELYADQFQSKGTDCDDRAGRTGIKQQTPAMVFAIAGGLLTSCLHRLQN